MTPEDHLRALRDADRFDLPPLRHRMGAGTNRRMRISPSTITAAVLAIIVVVGVVLGGTTINRLRDSHPSSPSFVPTQAPSSKPTPTPTADANVGACAPTDLSFVAHGGDGSAMGTSHYRVTLTNHGPTCAFDLAQMTLLATRGVDRQFIAAVGIDGKNITSTPVVQSGGELRFDAGYEVGCPTDLSTGETYGLSVLYAGDAIGIPISGSGPRESVLSCFYIDLLTDDSTAVTDPQRTGWGALQVSIGHATSNSDGFVTYAVKLQNSGSEAFSLADKCPTYIAVAVAGATTKSAAVHGQFDCLTLPAIAPGGTVSLNMRTPVQGAAPRAGRAEARTIRIHWYLSGGGSSEKDVTASS